MAKFAIGSTVQVINPNRPDFGEVGQVTSDYRSGQESQSYAVHFDESNQEYWIRETNLRAVDINALLAEKGKLYPTNDKDSQDHIDKFHEWYSRNHEPK